MFTFIHYRYCSNAKTPPKKSVKTGKVPVSSPAKWPLMLEAGWLTLWTTLFVDTFTPSNPILVLSLSLLELFYVSLFYFFCPCCLSSPDPFLLRRIHSPFRSVFFSRTLVCAFVIIFFACKCASKGSVLCQSLRETEKFDKNVRGLCNGFNWGLKNVCTWGGGMGGYNLFRTFVGWI